MLLSFQGNYLLNNRCVPCKHCRKGEFVVEECSPKQNTLCKKLPKSTRPSSTPHINSKEPVTRTKCVEGGTVDAVTLLPQDKIKFKFQPCLILDFLCLPWKTKTCTLPCWLTYNQRRKRLWSPKHTEKILSSLNHSKKTNDWFITMLRCWNFNHWILKKTEWTPSLLVSANQAFTVFLLVIAQ